MIKYTDYQGPRGDYAVLEGKIVPFDRDIAQRFAHNAHLLALGDPTRAMEMTVAAERVQRQRVTA